MTTLPIALTRQQAFDQVLAHMRKQRVPSVHYQSGTCMYRGPNGTKCAIGALIPDEYYNPTLEGTDASAYGNLFTVGDGFLMAMQEKLHDDPADDISARPFLQVVEHNAAIFADMWQLTYTPPTPAV